MSPTIDIPDELSPGEGGVRAAAAISKDLVEEGLRRVLQAPESKTSAQRPTRPSVHDLMQDSCGIVKDAPADYATNPKYMEEFGR